MNNMPRSRYRVLICAAIALTTSAVLTGCANPIESLVESASGSAAESLLSEVTGSEIDGLGSIEIPADFPKIVPLPDLELGLVISPTSEGPRTWILHFEKGVNEKVYDDLLADLVANGFIEEQNTDVYGEMRITMHSNSEYMVTTGLIGKTGEDQNLQFTVAEKTSE